MTENIIIGYIRASQSELAKELHLSKTTVNKVLQPKNLAWQYAHKDLLLSMQKSFTDHYRQENKRLRKICLVSNGILFILIAFLSIINII